MTAPAIVPESVRRRHQLALQLQELREKHQRLTAQRQTRWQQNPVGWVETRLGEFLWSKQREIAQSVVEHRKTAVHSCHASGKSWLAARLACFWLDTHLPGEAFVVSSAPTYPQVRAILWREIRAAHRKGGLPGKVTQVEWKIDNELVGIGRKPADTDEAGFQGIHARYILVVLDEAGGIPEQLWNAADALATNADARMVAIGNPDDNTSHFADVCKPGSGWNVIGVDGLQTPNVTGEEVPDHLRQLLISTEWIEEKRRIWGEDSPLWTAKVRGIFPDDAMDTIVVPLSFIRRCQTEREYRTEQGLPDQVDPDLEPVELGVDVGAGGDATVVWERRGVKLGRVWREHSPDAMRVTGRIVQAIQETGAVRVKIDVIGVGHGVAGRLEELGRPTDENGQRRQPVHRADIVRVNVANRASDTRRFSRLRDELWWTFRETCQMGSIDLRALDDDAVAQLIAPRYRVDSSGRVVVESKDETRKRLGRSPDDADAILMAFLSPKHAKSKKLVSW